MMRVTLWGTRGSIPVWGSRFMRHGGATTCVEIELQDARAGTPDRIIIDCGTGLAELGRKRQGDWSNVLMLQTHLHWDHIQGFPFFGPIFNPKANLSFLAVDRDGRTFENVLSDQMRAPTFPVTLDIAPANLNFQSIPREGEMTLGELKLTWTEVWHPSGSTAWRLEYRGASFVFTGDVETQQGSHDALVSLAEGADVLMMDSQYFPDEYQAKVGWGHSTPLDAVGVARDAEVGRLLLTHHDPLHDDTRLDIKLKLARRASGHLLVENAYDGMELDLQGTQEEALAIAS